MAGSLQVRRPVNLCNRLASPGPFRRPAFSIRHNWKNGSPTSTGKISGKSASARSSSEKKLPARTGSAWKKPPRNPLTGHALIRFSESLPRKITLTTLSNDRDLLQKRFLLTPDHQLEHVLHSENGGWAVKQALLTQTRGLRITGNVDRLVGDILAGCDGSRPLIDLVSELSGHLKIDVEKIIPSCLLVIKKLLENGFLSIG